MGITLVKHIASEFQKVQMEVYTPIPLPSSGPHPLPDPDPDPLPDPPPPFSSTLLGSISVAISNRTSNLLSSPGSIVILS
ncbi:hypothetical protein OUZ56_027319 [Daphnia magna]|uniref:Uncharacterized protein n=1 Tax=Daphnia magna TaxID=35525 RepID=A0ABQ9ZPF6_9CRUS|nr:hypothetical protein OUZ56_027319 [Daphnia magna]